MTKSWMRAALCGGLLGIFAGTALASDYRLGDLEIGQPWTRATVAGQPAAGAYFSIHNAGSDPDRLVSVESPVARAAELHDMKVENGVMKMRPLADGVAVPAGATVELAPGGMHVMLLGPEGALKPGQQVPLRLTFEKAGTVEVELTVEKPGAKAASPAQGHDAGHGKAMNHGTGG